jgi:hypothetical protein
VKLINAIRFLAFRNCALVLAVSVCGANVVGTALAQNQPPGAPPIQVKSDEILVPVLVLDQKRIDAIHQMDLGRYLSEVKAPNSRLLVDLAVTDLTSGEFHIFEDGKEQTIQRVAPEPGWNLNPPAGPELESVGSPPDAPDSNRKSGYYYVALPHWPTYQISYAPPPAPSGSCHTVNVKVDRRNSYVLARSEYCNTTHAVYDVLNGTPLGNRMAADLGATDHGPVRLMATAFSLFRGNAASYTDIVLNTSSQSRRLEDCTRLPEIGFLGMIYSSDGKLAARFSGRAMGGDFYASHHEFPMLVPRPLSNGPCYLTGPNVFEARLDLPPGEYRLQAVIRDGKRFGRTEIPIRVESSNGTQLAISDIALGKYYRQVSVGLEHDLDVSPDRQIPLISKGVEVIPTADTRFKAGVAIDFYFEVYAPLQSAPPAGKIEVEMRILDAETGEVAKQTLPADTAPYREPGDPIIPFGGGIGSANLPSGSYKLQARATDSTGQSTAWSSVAFSIQ